MKKWIALLLAAVLLLGLVACGGSEKTDGEETAAANGGTKYHGELPFVKEGDEPITITFSFRTFGDVTDFKDNKFTHYLEEKTGLNLEFILLSGTASEAATQIALMIASGEELPDVIRLGGISKIQADEYGLDGYFVDLSDYFGKYNYYQNLAFETYFPDDPSVYRDLLEGAKEPGTGKIFCFPTFSDNKLDAPRYNAWVNQEWLDKLGLEMPHTIAELHDVLVAFRDQDPNGNGKKDEIPMIGKANANYYDVLRPIINAYVLWNHSYNFNVDDDGKLWTPYNTDEYREALILIKDWVDEGLISTLTWTQTTTEAKNLLNPADDEDFLCGVTCGHPDVSFTPGGKSIFAYNPLPPLAAETDKGGYAPLNSYIYNYSTFITYSCKHPLEAFKLLDFMCEPETSLWARWGEKGVNWDYSDGSKPGNAGGTARIKLIGDPVLSTQNSQNWHDTLTVNSERYWEYESDIGNLEDWDSCRATKLLQNYENFVNAKNPEKICTHLNYTQEENERRTEISNELNTYFNDRRAQFCTGVLDPRNDAQWQEYLDGMEALGYSEWVEITQAAYDRQANQ